MVTSNDNFAETIRYLQEILPDKVMRGMSYMELAAMDHYQPAIDFYKNKANK
jgi:hypothetical protein